MFTIELDIETRVFAHVNETLNIQINDHLRVK